MTTDWPEDRTRRMLYAARILNDSFLISFYIKQASPQHLSMNNSISDVYFELKNMTYKELIKTTIDLAISYYFNSSM